MFYDLIIVSQSRPELIAMTQRCIDTALADTKDINVILVETGQPYKYENVNKFVEYNGEFKYNRALNLGLKYVKGDVHILANNDLIFHEGWSKIGELMRLNDYHSASVLSSHQMSRAGDHVYEGYRISVILNGWCIFIDKYCLDKIGQLDDTCSFWFSDDIYACQLQAVGIRHGLFCNCQVDHIASQTLLRQSPSRRRKYELGEVHQFNQRRKYYAENERLRNDNT